VPDISKIERLTGYSAMLDLPEMLGCVIAYDRGAEGVSRMVGAVEYL
jgi:hypothetical protein